MITLITGAPGAGKTAALVSMLADLGKDRAIYAHGIPDLTVPHVALDDPTTWPDTVPDGSVIIIDEVQTVWRPSGPGQKIPDHIAKLETHRHRGLDFYIITQGPNLVHSNVRALVGRHVHLRDIGYLGRWWYEWPETADNCRTGWKNAPIKKRYRLPKHIFSSYKSASVHVKPVRSFPMALVVLAVALVGVVWLGWGAIQTFQQKANGGPLPNLTDKPAKPAQAITVANMPPSDSNMKPSDGNMQQTAFIDDRIAFIPRVSDRPETAPAYDGIRQVVNMPLVIGGACFKGACKCYTQQGTDAGLSDSLCRQWIENPRFDPYTPQAVTTSATSGAAYTGAGRIPSSSGQNAPAPAQAATVPMPAGVAENPRAETLQPSAFPPGSPVHTTPAMGTAGTIPALSLKNPYRQG